MFNILVTASTGFVGTNFLNLHEKYSHNFIFLKRKKSEDKKFINFDLNSKVYNDELFRKIDVIIHIAGQAHTTFDSKESRRNCVAINYDATIRLAEKAKKNGIKKFVFLSSIKAAGSVTGKNLTENIYSDNIDLYGKCKREAEKKLLEIASKSEMDVTILRSSLMYGPLMKGNLNNMYRMILSGYFPIPTNSKAGQSMVHVYDVIDALVFVSTNNSTNNQIYNLTDGREYSFREIYDQLSLFSKKNKFNIKFPKVIFFSLSMLGSLINIFIKFPFTYKHYKKIFSNSTFSSKRIRGLGFETKYDLSKFMIDKNRENK